MISRIYSTSAARRCVSLPYSVQTNDVPAYFEMKVSVPEFEAMLRRQFDTLYREGETIPRVMAIAVHPFVTGQPHRIGAIGAGALSPALYGLIGDAISLPAAMLLVAAVVLFTLPLAWRLSRVLRALASAPRSQTENVRVAQANEAVAGLEAKQR
jgi:hypothetical protein